ncbi:hypothetical protein B5M09_011663 [Aphanomyces astaci]|uniref:Peptidase A2 domain-containing protein n=1 Tax=Aphanomyces astaci TaxID=112090 RepID=A0A425DIN1_APHAT|nr:hypothetical protein B5M09_011663 [Aphanomyces astaci]
MSGPIGSNVKRPALSSRGPASACPLICWAGYRRPSLSMGVPGIIRSFFVNRYFRTIDEIALDKITYNRRLTAPGEAETLLAAQVKRWKDGIKVLVNQPQRQKTERGVLLENIVRVDDVLLDSGSDVTVVTRGVMDALDAAGVKVGTVSHSVPHLAYPYGSDAKPVVMTRSVKFNCVSWTRRVDRLCCAV